MKALLRRAAATIVAGVAISLTAHAGEGGHRHEFHDARQWSEVFDDPRRDEWQKPHEVIAALNLKPDATVVDIGAGTGYFTARLAHMLPGAKVYAVDAEPDMVKHLKQRATQSGLKNVQVVQATVDDPRLPEKADLILLVGVYHHIANRVGYFSRLRDSLKPGGRVAIVDFRMDSPVGPPKSGRVAPDVTKRELGEAGYLVAAEHDFLPYQYYLIFRPRAK